MRRPSPLLGAGCAIALSFSSSGLIGASSVPARPLISLDDAGGFRLVSERLLPNGAAVATFRAGEVMVSVIGRPASSASISVRAPATRPVGGTLRAALATTRPKTAKDATAYRDSGRTVIDDLVALGMPRQDAERQFGDLATLDGDADVVTRDSVRVASGSSGPGAITPTRAAPAPAASTPYDAQCAAINVAEGKITGYGCSTLFLVRRDGNDWWLTTKMKVSAHSSDESWFSPKRLTQLGWRLSWATGNVLYDWDPYQTRAIGSCLTMTVKSSSPWAEVSVQGTVCPDSLGPWSVTTARSGGIWNGMENGTEYEGALATQAIHSPPGAPVSYQSAWTLSYCDLWCN
jgi:hypothetical protein